MKQSLISALLVGQGLASPVAKPQFGGPGGVSFDFGLDAGTQANTTEMDEKALAHIEQMFSSWQDTNGNNGALSQLITTLSAKFPVLNYGCYCFINADPATTGSQAVFAELPGSLPGFGGATPVDELDSLCYELMRYQQCIVSDVSAGLYDTPCSLNDGYYYQTMETTGTGDHGCTEEDWKPDGSYNPAQSYKTMYDCRHALCMGDRHFSNEVAALYESGTFSRTPAYFGMNQKGTYATNCVAPSSGGSNASGGAGGSTNNGGNAGVDQCCGFEVNRKPMNTGNAQCCIDSSTGNEYLAGLGDICS